MFKMSSLCKFKHEKTASTVGKCFNEMDGCKYAKCYGGIENLVKKMAIYLGFDMMNFAKIANKKYEFELKCKYGHTSKSKYSKFRTFGHKCPKCVEGKFNEIQIEDNIKTDEDKITRSDNNRKEYQDFEGEKLSGFSDHTGVLMHDGTIKELKDVVIEDKLWNDQGCHTEVLNVISFTDCLYEVMRSKSNVDSLTITYHTPLVLKATGIGPTIGKHKSGTGYRLMYYKKCKSSICCINKPDTCPKVSFKMTEINKPFNEKKSAEDAKDKLLKGELDKEWVAEGDVFEFNLHEREKICTVNGKDRAKIFKVPRPVQINQFNKLPIDSYWLGLWLGDGTVKRPQITTADSEVMNFLERYAMELGYKLSTHKTNKGHISITGVVSKKDYYACDIVQLEGGNPYKRNILCTYLRDLGIFEDKRIPEIYMNASEEERFRLLAGLIDSDGCLLNNIVDGKTYQSYTFSQGGNHEHLFADVKKLAESLDLNIRKPFSKPYSPIGRETFKDGELSHQSYTIYITGSNIQKIPCLIDRKKIKEYERQNAFNYHSSKITKVESLGIGNCIKLELDGNGRFLLADYTVVRC